MSLSTSFLNSASFLSLKACQAAFSFPSIAALSGVAAMETAMAPKRTTIAWVMHFFIVSLSLRLLQMICVSDQTVKTNPLPVQIEQHVSIQASARRHSCHCKSHGIMGADSRGDFFAGVDVCGCARKADLPTSSSKLASASFILPS